MLKFFIFILSKTCHTCKALGFNVCDLTTSRKLPMTLRYGTIKVRAGTDVKPAVLRCFKGHKTVLCTVLITSDVVVKKFFRFKKLYQISHPKMKIFKILSFSVSDRSRGERKKVASELISKKCHSQSREINPAAVLFSKKNYGWEKFLLVCELVFQYCPDFLGISGSGLQLQG